MWAIQPGPAAMRRDLSGSIFAYTNKVKALSPIAYWPLADLSGTTATDESGNARNGSYVGSPTLGVTGIGDGRTAATFDGSTQYVNIYSASLNGAFTGQLFTVAGWFKIPNWADVGQDLGIRLRVDASNDFYFDKFGTNSFRVNYASQGQALKTIAQSTSTAAYFHFAATVSKAADQFIAYYNGVQTGATQTGLGAWAGNLLSTGCCIAAGATTPANLFAGTSAHLAIFPAALSAAQILSLATVP